MSGYPARPLAERFWEKVSIGEGCWLWQGAVQSGGYGNFAIRKHKFVLAHRLAYELVYGPIPPGMEVDHLCEYKLCVNPLHLEAETPVVNTRRASRGQAVKTHCARGHEFTQENTYLRPDRPGRICRACGRENTARYRAEAA